MTRTRFKTDRHTANYKQYSRSGSVSINQNFVQTDYHHWCQDEDSNPGGNNPLKIIKFDNSVNINATTYRDGIPHRQLTNWNYSSSYEAGWNPPLKATDVANLINRSSPSKPLVDLPLFLFELKDLPGMAREAASFGKSLPWAVRSIKNQLRELRRGRTDGEKQVENLATLNLGLNMGYVPLIDDLVKLLKLAKAVERRRRELERMRLGKFITKGYEIDNASYSAFYTNANVGYSNVFPIWGNIAEFRRAERWASIRWAYKPGTVPDAPPTDLDAILNLLGLRLSAASVYNAIPWSFLVDYFVNIGEVLEASQNMVEFECSHLCEMTRYDLERTITAVSLLERPGDVGAIPYRAGGGRQQTVEKHRRPLSSLVTPSFQPYLSWKQVSILGSLGIARRSAWRN